MKDKHCSLPEILGDLEMLRDHESKLIRALTALVDSPDQPDVPEHVRQVLKLAREAFHDEAARFLMDRHMMLNDEAPINVAQSPYGAKEVETLLGRIVHGICV